MAETSIIRDLDEVGDKGALERLVVAADRDTLGDEDLAELAKSLARSGAELTQNPVAVDVASTGGPSSLSTLLCPLQLHARGFAVPTLGVPGRPAGGVDVLQQIPGYRAELDPEQAARALEQFGIIHLAADTNWTPLDARLFSFRQRAGFQAVAPLVIASILSKKIAMGVVGAALEIRIAPHGNFGADFEAARENAVRYSAVAEMLSLKPTCALTDGSRPYQPHVGRGEALSALATLISGKADGWLADHQVLCEEIAKAVLIRMGSEQTDPPDHVALTRAFVDLLEAHGTTYSAFERRVAEIRAVPRVEMRAERDGIVEYDLVRIRDIIVGRQRATPQGADQPSDPVGVILGPRGGTQVRSGELLMSVRMPDGESKLAVELSECVQVDVEPRNPRRAEGTLEVI
jgi:pyrimidine-nucleoside phosphorylase